MEKERRDITINDVTSFVTSRARAANHPVFGRIDKERKERIDPNQKRPRPLGMNANGFATHGEQRTKKEQRSKKHVHRANRITGCRVVKGFVSSRWKRGKGL